MDIYIYICIYGHPPHDLPRSILCGHYHGSVCVCADSVYIYIYMYIHIYIYVYKYILYIYDPGSRFATTPPPPSHGMVPKPAFCSILHENVVFAVFLARWLAGAVCKPANSQEFLQQTFRKRVICNVSGSENVLFAILYLSISYPCQAFS